MRKLTCHCGEIEAEINLDGDLQKILQCNCSICKRRNAVMSMVKNKDFKIVKGEEKLKLYQFHTKVAKHYFCSNCGIYTHHNPRANPAMTGFNVGCIDEINLKQSFFTLRKQSLIFCINIIFYREGGFDHHSQQHLLIQKYLFRLYIQD